eukprot:TRINITY_DN9430_c0_g1_i1.p2 TRINITY_DN9430_c0_g1~~TRINITY_DN9430_c0_g1_i1.p2  ORF type:complete len:559 (-),score=137.22 TRINITY_DN9430_c0_g1_i1:235-1911(-)
MKACRRFLLLTNVVVLPLAALLLARELRSLRLLLLPLATGAVAALTSLGLVALLGRAASLDALTPSVMLCLVAMCINYSLLMLTKLKEELCQDARGDEAAAADVVGAAAVACVEATGVTVLTSGLLLFVAFAALATAQAPIVSSFGIGGALTLVVVVAAHLTLVPALVVEFSDFFAAAFDADALERADLAEPASAVTRVGSAAPRREPRLRPYAAGWTRIAALVSNPQSGVAVVLSVVLLSAAAGLLAVQAGALSLPARHLTQQPAMWAGGATTYRLLLEPSANDTSALSRTFWLASRHIVRTLEAELGEATFVFPTLELASGERPSGKLQPLPSNNDTEPHAMRKKALLPADFEYAAENYVNANASAMFGFAKLEIDPFGPIGKSWLRSARRLSARLSLETGRRVTILGPAADVLDSLDDLHATLYCIVPATFFVAFLALAFIFRSLPIASLSIINVLFSQIFACGCVVLSEQLGLGLWVIGDGATAFASPQVLAAPLLVPVVSLGSGQLGCIRTLLFKSAFAQPGRCRLRLGVSQLLPSLACASSVAVAAERLASI